MNDDVADLAAQIAAKATELTQAVQSGAVVSTELVVVRLAKELNALTVRALQAGVTGARDAGHSWQELGDLLGVSRQAAFQRFGRPVDPRTGETMTTDPLPGAADRAVTVLADFLEGRFDEIVAGFDGELAQQAGGPDAVLRSLTSAAPQIAAMVGRYERMGEPAVSMRGALTEVDIPLTFEAGEMKGRIVFTFAGKIAGLFVLLPEAP
ncbi:MAG TPA: hypothetical protein VGM10_25305 [Actinocrinis sp.]|jgi:hypothetical protein